MPPTRAELQDVSAWAGSPRREQAERERPAGTRGAAARPGGAQGHRGVVSSA
jgi:hypothetical protein